MAPTTQKVCVEMLEEEILRPKAKPTLSDVYQTVLKMAQCFVATTRQVDEISKELYGNGEPDGLKLAMQRLSDDLAAVKAYLEIGDEAKFGRRREDVPTSMADKMLKWAVEKVLPALVISMIMLIGQVFVFAFVVMVAFSNGWIQL